MLSARERRISIRTDDGSVTSVIASNAKVIAYRGRESPMREITQFRGPGPRAAAQPQGVIAARAAETKTTGHKAGLEYELPPFSWDEFLVDSILEARLKELGLETIGDLGILAVYALENHLTGSTGLRAQRLLLDFKDTLERSFIFRPWSTTLELSSSHSDGHSAYKCEVRDDEAALWWRVDLHRADIEDVSPRVPTPRDLLRYARAQAFTSWECRTSADLLGRTVFPFFDQDRHVDGVLETLTMQHQRVLSLRFGLEDGKRRTLEEVGAEFNVTRERIRQIEGKALRNLRHPSRSNKLKTVLQLANYLANLLALGFDADLFTSAYGAVAGKTNMNPVGSFELVNEVFGDRAWAPALLEFEARIFESLADRLGRLPTPQELTLPPIDIVRLVTSDEAVLDTIKDQWPLFSPYGRLKLVASNKLRSGGLNISSTRVRLNALHYVLRNEDRPLHFSEIAERANSRLPSKYKMSKRNVYAWLTRYTDRFVWAGQGKYGLKEWDVGRRVDQDTIAIPEELNPKRRRGISEEIILLLLEAGEPLHLVRIEEHILSRFSVNLSSVQATIVQDTARRFILDADGRVSLAQWDRAARARGQRTKEADIDAGGTLSLQPFVDALDMGSVAFPLLKPGERRKALDLSRDVTLGIVRQFVNVVSEPSNPKANEEFSALAEAFKSNTRFNHLRSALSLFDEQLEKWMRGSRRDPRFSWILPDDLANELLSERSHWRDIESRLRGVRSWRSRLWRSGHVDGWLPLLSMEGIIAVGRSQNSDVMRLSAALGIACLRQGLEPHLRPWLADWPTQLSALPVGWLYQFDPTPRSETMLRRLDEAGCTNVGHLVILNPEALTLCRRVSTPDWATLKIAFHR